MPVPTYIISKVADPIFAVFIGLSAAATRINREEKEKGKATSETIDSGLRYVRKCMVPFYCYCDLYIDYFIGNSPNKIAGELGSSRPPKSACTHSAHSSAVCHRQQPLGCLEMVAYFSLVIAGRHNDQRTVHLRKTST